MDLRAPDRLAVWTLSALLVVNVGGFVVDRIVDADDTRVDVGIGIVTLAIVVCLVLFRAYERRARSLTDSEEVKLALMVSGTATWAISDPRGPLRTSESFSALHGLERPFRGSMLDYAALADGADRERVADVLRAWIEGSDAGFRVTFRRTSEDGATRDLELRGTRRSGSRHAYGVVVDVTAEREMQRVVESRRQRVDFLNAAAPTLSASLDRDQTLALLCGLACEGIADWAFVHMADGDLGLRRATLANADPEDDPLAEEIRRFHPPRAASGGLLTVLRTGTPQLWTTVEPSDVAASSTDGYHESLIRRTGVRSALAVPLLVGGEVIGTYSLYSKQAGRYTWEDVAVIEGLCLRAALSIENARLYSEVQEALREREEAITLADALFEAAPGGIAVYDRSLRCVRMNRALMEMNGFTAADFVGKTATEIFGEDASEVLERHRTVLSTGLPLEAAAVEFARWPGRSFLNVHFPLKAADGEVTGVCALVFDVSEQRQIEAQQQQSQRLESVGRMAGSVAHDFNNILATISGYSDLLREDVVSVAGLQNIDEIKRATDRAAQLTGRLLDFSRRRVSTPPPAPLVPTVNDSSRLFAAAMRSGVRLVIDDGSLDQGLHVALGDTELTQVLMNLVLNACDAGAATVTISLAAETEAASAPRSATIVVSDDGPGIAAEDIPHLFDPGFTRRAGGFGLGLATVFGLVHQAGGTVLCESEPGSGARFTVDLPIVARPDAVGDAAPPATVQAHPAGRALVVEDEESLRHLLARFLAEMGIDTTLTASGEEAIRLVEGGERFDLLVTDVMMPGINGIEMAVRLRGLDEGLAVVVISGYPDDPGTTEFVRRPRTRFMEKPFGRQAFDTTVGELLREGAAVSAPAGSARYEI
jgi:PAS domain S-box-containing protein